MSRILGNLTLANSKSVMGNLVKTSIIIPLGMLLLFVLNIYFARYLGAEDYGRLATVLQWSNIIGVILSLGLPMAGQRLVAQYAHIGDRQSSQAYISFVVLYVMSVSMVLLFAVVWAYMRGIDSFYLGIGICSISCILWLLQRYFSLGLNSVLFAILPRDVFFPILMIVLLWSFSIDSFESVVVLYGMLLTVICLFSTARAFKANAMVVSPLQFPSLTKIKGWLKISIPFSVTSFSQLGLNGSEVILLSLFLNPVDVGIYVLASKLALLCGLITRVLSVSVGQTFAEIHADSRNREFRRLYGTVALLSFFITLVIMVIYILYGQHILNFIGSEYSDGYLVLLILVAGHGLAASMGPVVIALNMSGNQNYTASVAIIAAVANICLLIMVLPNYGIVGGAVVASGVLILSRSIQFFFLSANLKTWD